MIETSVERLRVHMNGLAEEFMGTAFIDAYGNEAESYGTGETVYVRVGDQNANQPGVFDYVPVPVTSAATRDNETVVFAEAGKSCGVYEGPIQLQDSSTPSTSDGYLQAVAGETIEVTHEDSFGHTQSSDQALIDLISVVFVDAAHVPADEVLESDWARVRVFALADNSEPRQAGITAPMLLRPVNATACHEEMRKCSVAAPGSRCRASQAIYMRDRASQAIYMREPAGAGLDSVRRSSNLLL